MSRKQLRVSARARLLIEVTNLGAWTDEVQADQVMKQAKEEALNHVRRLAGAGVPPVHFRIVGEPEVTMVLVEEEA